MGIDGFTFMHRGPIQVKLVTFLTLIPVREERFLILLKFTI